MSLMYPDRRLGITQRPGSLNINNGHAIPLAKPSAMADMHAWVQSVARLTVNLNLQAVQFYRFTVLNVSSDYLGKQLHTIRLMFV